jgi:NTE family protein
MAHAASDSARNPSRKLGVALGGGAALGWAHIGALRALETAGVEVGAVAGTSIGALVGACWLCGVLGPLEDIARAMNWRRIIGLADAQLGAPGLLKGTAVIAEMERYIGGRRIEELEKPFAAVATDLISGKEVLIGRGPVTDAVRASISIPGLFLPVQQDHALLVDGGLVNPVPVSALARFNVDVTLAIDVTGDYQGRVRAAGIGAEEAGAAAEDEAAPPRWRAVAGALFRRSARRLSAYGVTTASAALIMRELARAKLALGPPDIHVVPEVGHISPVDFVRADELIEAGRSAMTAQIEPLKAMLATTHAKIPRET